MTCPTATGACTLAQDGACTVPKEHGVIAPLSNVFIQGLDNGFTVAWDTAINPNETVTMLYKKDGSGTSYESIIQVDRDDGLIETPLTLDFQGVYFIWLRPENDTEFGEWQLYIAIIDSGWDSEAQEVAYGNDIVFYGSDPVLHTQQ